MGGLMSLITQFSITLLPLMKELICIECYFVTHNFIDPVFCLFACVVEKKRLRGYFAYTSNFMTTLVLHNQMNLYVLLEHFLHYL